MLLFFQSQSHPSSPASYDEQNETCDTPEDPMSAAESEVVTCILMFSLQTLVVGCFFGEYEGRQI